MATATKQSTTVRISEQGHHRLRELAAQSGEPMQAILDKALEQYRRQKFWEEMSVAYAAIENDPEAVAAEKAELRIWEATLMDGLDPDEDWSYLNDAPPEEGTDKEGTDKEGTDQVEKVA